MPTTDPLPTSLAMLLFAILPSILAAPKVLASPLVPNQHDLALRNLPIGVTTRAVEFDYSPNPEYNEKEHYKIVNLFKRGCTLPQGGVCSEGAACCNNPNEDGSGWCCNSGKLCGDGSDSTFCMLSTVFETTTTTSTDIITEGSAPVATRVAESTETKTETWTTIITTTDRDASTYTKVITKTVSEDNDRKRATKATGSPALLAEKQPTPRQPALLPRQTSISNPSHGFNLRDLFPRQEVAPKVTSTVTETVTETSTTSATGLFTDFYTETRTSTATSTLTSTEAPNAQTTTTETWTFTVPKGETAAPLITGGSQQPEPADDDDEEGSLSAGAKAGIGVGVSALALAGLGVGAFLLYRRRKNRQLEAGSAAAAPLTKPDFESDTNAYGQNSYHGSYNDDNNNNPYNTEAYNNAPYDPSVYYNTMKPQAETYAYLSGDQGGAHEMHAVSSHPAPQELPSDQSYAEMPGSDYPGPDKAQPSAPLNEMSAQNYR